MNFPNNLNTCGFVVKPSRFEVVDHRSPGNGRDFVKYNCHVHLQASSDGSCLMVCLTSKKSDNALTHNFASCASASPETVTIEDYGSIQTFYNDVEIKIDVQDGGLTLKLFLYDR